MNPLNALRKLPTKHKIALVEVVIMVLLALWLFLPKSFQRAMGYDFDPDQVTAVAVVLSNQEEERDIDLDPADPAYEELISLLESKRYMAQGDGQRAQRAGLEYGVTIRFTQKAGEYKVNFVGEDAMNFRASAESGFRAFRTSDPQAFQQEILTFLLEQEGT